MNGSQSITQVYEFAIRLQNQLNEINDNVEKKTQKHMIIMKEYQKVQNQLKEKDRKIDELKKLIDTLNEKHENEIMSLNLTIDILKTEIQKLKDELASF